MKKRAFIYMRVSTREQVEGYSLSEQEDRLIKYCDAMEWTVAKLYRDGGYSGSELNRPAMNEMIRDIEHGQADVVLVDKLDRLSRSQFDTLYLIKKVFTTNHVSFVSRAEAFDTGSSFGRAMVGILAVFAELERERIRERMSEGKEGRAKEGKWQGGGAIPIGYDYDSSSGSLVINEYEAMQVREMFDMFNERMPIYRIMVTLNEKGYRTKYGKWMEMTIRNILSAKNVIGKIKYKGEWYEGMHESIITDEVFERAQQILKERDRKFEKHKVGKRYRSPFGGLIYCANCGAKYMWKTNGRNKDGTYRNYYMCYSRSKSDKSLVRDWNCKNKTYRDYEFEKLIYGQIRLLKSDAEYIDKLRENVDNSEQKSMIQKRINEIGSQISRYMDLYSLNKLNMKDIQTKIDPLTDERNALELQLECLEGEMPVIPKQNVLDLVDMFEQAVSDGDPYKINRIITELIDHIIIDGEDIQIHWNF